MDEGKEKDGLIEPAHYQKERCQVTVLKEVKWSTSCVSMCACVSGKSSRKEITEIYVYFGLKGDDGDSCNR